MSSVITFFGMVLVLYLLTNFLSWSSNRPNNGCSCGYRDDATRLHGKSGCPPR
jgi:hypothetical protein